MNKHDNNTFNKPKTLETSSPINLSLQIITVHQHHCLHVDFHVITITYLHRMRRRRSAAIPGENFSAKKRLRSARTRLCTSIETRNPSRPEIVSFTSPNPPQLADSGNGAVSSTLDTLSWSLWRASADCFDSGSAPPTSSRRGSGSGGRNERGSATGSGRERGRLRGQRNPRD